MGTKLYVGNLPFSVDESSLRSLFEQNDRKVEEISLITDRETGRPRGFGFIEMGSREDADKAIQELNGHEHNHSNTQVAQRRHPSLTTRDGPRGKHDERRQQHRGGQVQRQGQNKGQARQQDR